MEPKFIIGLIIFLVSFYYIINEKIPGVWVTLFGGSLMVMTGVITREQGTQAIGDNLPIILLLLAMMIIVNIISETGFFQWVAFKVAIAVQMEPIKLLIVFGVITGILSAFLDNVTTVLLVIPVIIVITKELEIPPKPYILIAIICSNIGGAATLIGDPPNLIISNGGNLSFNSFLIHAAPLAIINMVVVVGFFVAIYRKKLIVSKELREKMLNINVSDAIKDKVLLKKSLIVIGIVIVSFIFESIQQKGLENVALLGALYLAIRLKKTPYDVFVEIEWEMIFFLIGLFILIRGIEELRILENLSKMLVRYSNGNIKIVSVIILWISNISTLFIGSISHAVTFSPLVGGLEKHFNDKNLWWALSYGTCYGGIGTIVASACNLVGIKLAKKFEVNISSKEYLKFGLLAMLLCGVMSTVYIVLIN